MSHVPQVKRDCIVIGDACGLCRVCIYMLERSVYEEGYDFIIFAEIQSDNIIYIANERVKVC